MDASGPPFDSHHDGGHHADSHHVDTLIRNARLVPVGPVASGAAGPTDLGDPVDLLIKGGVLVVVGPDLPAAETDQVIDAEGRWAIPGLWDAHVHLRQWAQTRTQLDVGSARSAADVTDLVRRHIGGLESLHSVVLGHGYRSAAWPAQPTVQELDAVSGAHPVLLTSGDAHNGWLNSAALRLLRVADRTGAIAENEWFDLMPAITALSARLSDDDAAYAATVNDAAARGIVGITDFELAYGFRDWPERFARGVDRIRVRAAIYPDGLDAVIAAGLHTGDVLPGTGGLATMGPLKIISDGSLNTRTAYCFRPYADAGHSAHPRGVQNYDLAELTGLLARARAGGLRVALHAIGDAAVSIGLDAFAATGARGGIEHAQLMLSEDISRMSALGLRASVQPAHLWDDRDVTQRCWPDRADRCFPFRSLLDAGVTLALGSDAPVAPLDPWLAMAAAVHRSTDEREPWNQAEAITVAQALAASTDGQPTLAPGSRGDVVLLDDDPFRAGSAGADGVEKAGGESAAAAQHLVDLRVAATFVAGRATYSSL